MRSAAQMNQVADGFVECESVRFRIEFSNERQVEGVAVERIDRCVAVAMQAITFDDHLSAAWETVMSGFVARSIRGSTSDRF